MVWTPSKVSEAAGISPSYASMILNGRRQPPLGTALKIYDTTGLQVGLLASLTPDEIETLGRKLAA